MPAECDKKRGRRNNCGSSTSRDIDFSSWQRLLATLIGLALFTLISIGIRLLMMFTIRLAEHAVREMVAGRPVHRHDLVVSLRTSFARPSTLPRSRPTS